MNENEKKAFETQLRSFVGRPIGPPATGRDAVNEPMIRQWCDAMGETHPAYLDADGGEEDDPRRDQGAADDAPGLGHGGLVDARGLRRAQERAASPP